MINLFVRIHFSIVMIGWTGLAPWQFEFPFECRPSDYWDDPKVTEGCEPSFVRVVRHPPQARLPHPTPYTLHPTPYTLHPTPYTLHPTPYTLHPAPYTLRPTLYTLHPSPYTLHPSPYTLHPTPYTKCVSGECVSV